MYSAYSTYTIHTYTPPRMHPPTHPNARDLKIGQPEENGGGVRVKGVGERVER